MAQAAKAQEPSMEEILASIRRIIADDDGKPAPRPEPPKAAAPLQPAPPPPKPAASPPPTPASEIDALIASSEPEPEPEEPEPTSDILDLTESMAAPAMPAEAPGFRTIDAQPDVMFADSSLEPEPLYRNGDGRREEPSSINERLLSGEAAAAVDSAFSSLAQTVLVQNARTLEDLVREMLRPMLKSWLDNNLPGLVERLVRAEIERVSRGRSG